jgi:hypothetical protein
MTLQMTQQVATDDGDKAATTSRFWATARPMKKSKKFGKIFRESAVSLNVPGRWQAQFKHRAAG